MKLNITINFYVVNVHNLEQYTINPSIYVEDYHNKSPIKKQLGLSHKLLAKNNTEDLKLNPLEKNNTEGLKLNPKSEYDCDCCQNTAIYYSPDGSNKFCILHQPNI